MESLNLKELIHQVRQELIESENERVQKGLTPLFKVDNLKIEVNFVVEKTKKSGGKLGIKIVEAGHQVSYSSQQIHKISLELNTIDDEEIVTPVRVENKNRNDKNRKYREIIQGNILPGQPGTTKGVRKISGSNPGILQKNPNTMD